MRRINPILPIAISLTLLFGFAMAYSQPPTISSFSPTSGAVGTSVTISGTNFSATLGDNLVFFGAVRAVVSNATATELTVTVPAGAVNEHITVLTNGLQAYSSKRFIVTFNNNGWGFDENSLKPKVDFASGRNPYSLAVSDFDGDGKIDLAVANSYNGAGGRSVSLFRNTGVDGSINLMSETALATGTTPYGMASGDLDGDGKADLALAMVNSACVSVFRNASSGPGSIGFGSQQTFGTGTQPYAVSMADFDADGKPDLAVVNASGANVSVLRNTSIGPGTITFDTKANFGTGTAPVSVATGDIDGDGKVDVIVANNSSNTISILRNVSSGLGAISFATKIDLISGAKPRSVSVGDLDRDGKMDLAVANEDGTVSLFRNTSTTGSISFDTEDELVTVASPRSIAIGDLDGDSRLDLIVAYIDSPSVSLFRNRGISGIIYYDESLEFDTGSGPFYVLPGDFDGDGKTDVAVANWSDNSVSILGNNVRSLAPDIESFSPRSGPVGTSVVITGTGFSSVADDNTVYFGATKALVTSAAARSLTAIVPAGADYQTISVMTDRFVGYSASPFTVTFARGEGFDASSYSTPLLLNLGGNSVAVKDLEGDGKVDLAGVDGGDLFVTRNVTSSPAQISLEGYSLPSPNNEFTPSYEPYGVTSADLNRDGNIDLAVTNAGVNKISTFANHGSGDFWQPDFNHSFDTGNRPGLAAIGDLDDDGKPDLVSVNILGNSVSVHSNATIDGFFIALGINEEFSAQSGAYAVCVADLNGDNLLEIVVANAVASTISVFKNLNTRPGDLSFDARMDFVTGAGPLYVSTGDFDGDQKLDVAVVNSGDNTVSVFRNISDDAGVIAFANPMDFPTGLEPYAITVGDFDGDGRLDLAVANYGSNTISMLQNVSTDEGIIDFASKVDFNVPLAPTFITNGDLDGDGRVDLVVSSYAGVVVLRRQITPEAPVALETLIKDPSSFEARWTESTGALAYYLDVSTSSIFAPDAFVYEDLFVGNKTSHVISLGLSPATEYFYRVRSADGEAMSASSNAISVVTLAPEPNEGPTGISVETLSPTSLNLSFLPAPGVDSYIALRKSGSSPEATLEDGTGYVIGHPLGDAEIVYIGTDTSFEDTGLTPDTHYFYDVFPFNGSDLAANYPASSPLEGSGITFANEPNGQPSELMFSSHSTTSLTLQFLPPPTTPDGYLILRKQGSMPTGSPDDGKEYTTGTSIDDALVVYAGSASVFEDSELVSATEYYYTVFSYNGAGAAVNYLTSTEENSGFSATLPEIPVLAAATDVTQASFHLIWSIVPRAAGYEVDVSTDGFINLLSGYDPKTVTTNELQIDQLSAGTTYQYRVRAVNSVGGMSSGPDPSGTQLTVPPTPLDVNVSATEQSQFTVSWIPSESATEYLIYISENSSFDPHWSIYGPKSVSSEAETVTGLSAGNTYFLKVSAKNNGGGPASPEAPTISQRMKPATPLAIDAINPNSNSFKAKWQAANGADSYEIDVSTANDFSVHVTGYPKNVGNILEEPVTGLESSTTYFYVVRAHNTTGDSPFSNPISAITDVAPGASITVETPVFADLILPSQSSATVSVQVSGGRGAKSVTLFYRKITNVDSYNGETMSNITGSTFALNIPLSGFDEIGTEFFIRGQDDSGDDETGLHYIFKSLPLQSGVLIPFAPGLNGQTDTYQMFSIPYDLADKNIDNLFDVALNGYDNTQWRLFHYENNSYKEYPNQFRQINLGDGYWFNTVVKDFQIVLGAATVAKKNQSDPFVKPLQPGWNQIGNPYPFNISWDAVVGTNDKIGSLNLFKSGNYTKSDVLKPWEGAFVHADEALTLSIPVTAKTNASGRSKQDNLHPDLDMEQWLLPVTLQIDGLQQVSGVGMHPEAKVSKDRFDEITIPRFLDYAEMNTHHKEFFSPHFSTDVVPTGNEYTWIFDVKSNLEGGQAELTWDYPSIVSNKSSLMLIDLFDGKWVDMKTTGRYTFTHKDGRQLRIVYNREGDIKPGVTLLGEAFPNPFTTEVTIPILVDKPGIQTVEIYDAFGRRIRTLVKNIDKPGLHELTWDIKGDSGGEVSAGLLYYRLQDSQQGRIKRIIKR